MIVPTVGRMVLYVPCADDPGYGIAKEMVAVVCSVVHSRLINVCVFDQNGTPFNRLNVPLMQDGDAQHKDRYCCWMPYQKAVARCEIAPVLHVEEPTDAMVTAGLVSIAKSGAAIEDYCGTPEDFVRKIFLAMMSAKAP